MKNMNMKQKTAIVLAGLSFGSAVAAPITQKGFERIQTQIALERIKTLVESIAGDGNGVQKQKGPGIGTTTITWTDDNGKEVALRIKGSILKDILGLENGFAPNWMGFVSETLKLNILDGKAAIIKVDIGPEGVIITAVPKDNAIAANAKVIILPIKPYIDENNEYRIDIKGQNIVFLGKDLNVYVINVDQTRVAYTNSGWDGSKSQGDIKVTIDETGKFLFKSQKTELKGMIKVEVPDTAYLIPENVLDLVDKSLDMTAKGGVVPNEPNIVVEGGKDQNGNAYNYQMTDKQMADYPKTKTFM